MVPTQTMIRPTNLASRGVRFDFLDGIRGFASLFVVLHHGLLEVSLQSASARQAMVFSPLLKWCTMPLLAGRFGVDIFIVLSGFCLTLPLVRSGRDRLPDLAEFFRRRCWRILPPYYAALLLSAVLIMTVPGLSTKTGGHWDIVLPAFTPRVWISHLLLFYNWSPATAYRINHALWSVATEWQIYLLFPLFLLPLRRLGMGPLIASAFAIGVAVHGLYPSADVARPWYVGLFAMGMCAAELGVSSKIHMAQLRRQAPWLVLASGCVAISMTMGFFRSFLANFAWVTDAAIGGAAACVIIWLTWLKTEDRSKSHRAILILEAPVSIWLGAISYSLYLVHPPIIAMCNLLALHRSSPIPSRLLVVLTLGTLGSLVAAIIFYLAVERWFVPKPKVADKVIATSPIPEPAPFGTAAA